MFCVVGNMVAGARHLLLSLVKVGCRVCGQEWMLTTITVISMSTDHKLVLAGRCRWIFSTINSRKFRKAGKVVEPHFILGGDIQIYVHVYICVIY